LERRYSETYENIGLNRYVKTPKVFKHYLTDKNENGDKHLVFPVLKDKNNDVWVGTRGLDYVFRIKPDGTALKTNICDYPKKSNAPKVKSMAQNMDGIWMGCTENTLIRYDFSTKKITQIKLDPEKVNTNLAIHNILMRGENIVINGADAVYLFETASQSLKPVYDYNNVQIYSMVEDGKEFRGSTRKQGISGILEKLKV